MGHRFDNGDIAAFGNVMSRLGSIHGVITVYEAKRCGLRPSTNTRALRAFIHGWRWIVFFPVSTYKRRRGCRRLFSVPTRWGEFGSTYLIGAGALYKSQHNEADTFQAVVSYLSLSATRASARTGEPVPLTNFNGAAIRIAPFAGN